MAHSIEARTPFLDHHLTEYISGLPPSMKIRYEAGRNGEDSRFVEKYILREAAKPFITKELYERRKHPYSAPTTYPEGGPLHKLFKRLLTRAKVEQLGFVEWAKAEGLVERAFAGNEPSAMRVALCVAQWVVIAERFSIGRAEPPKGWKEQQRLANGVAKS
ncbi:hypothetical protein LTS18_003402 [Coniosporium uncinatum]|uniref:Uncharacterized protein n=1 Tax=Coniosporium uncinatum TaxID=93489 RepID=A0ACC3D771_9PEZI|nr:hypothetical protein LTS18_003402 [Coniosporium uncinatum]